MNSWRVTHDNNLKRILHVVWASCDSLNGRGNGFAGNPPEPKGVAAPQHSCDVVLPVICPKLICPTTEGPSLSWYSRIWERRLSSPCPNYS